MEEKRLSIDDQNLITGRTVQASEKSARDIDDRSAAEIFGVYHLPASSKGIHSEYSSLETTNEPTRIDHLSAVRYPSEWASRLTAEHNDVLIKELKRCFRKSLYWRNEKSKTMTYRSFERGMYDTLISRGINIEQLWEDATKNGQYPHSVHTWTTVTESAEILAAIHHALSLQNPSGASRQLAEINEAHETWKILLLPSDEMLARLRAAHLCGFASSLDLRSITISLIACMRNQTDTAMLSNQVVAWDWLPLQEIQELDSQDIYKKATCDFFFTVCRILGKSLMVLPFDAVQVLSDIMSVALNTFDVLGSRRGLAFRTRPLRHNPEHAKRRRNNNAEDNSWSSVAAETYPVNNPIHGHDEDNQVDMTHSMMNPTIGISTAGKINNESLSHQNPTTRSDCNVTDRLVSHVQQTPRASLSSNAGSTTAFGHNEDLQPVPYNDPLNACLALPWVFAVPREHLASFNELVAPESRISFPYACVTLYIVNKREMPGVEYVAMSAKDRETYMSILRSYCVAYQTIENLHVCKTGDEVLASQMSDSK